MLHTRINVTAVRSLQRAWALVPASVLVLLASACSDPAVECTPPIPPGAQYRVTLGPETARSNACHVVSTDYMRMFMITAGDPQSVSSADPLCSSTPAAGPPPQTSLQLVSCRGNQNDAQMLGTSCNMRYLPSLCDGFVWFSFDTPVGAPPVNWTLPVVDAVFRIKDNASGCLPNIANCTDEYSAHLERVQ